MEKISPSSPSCGSNILDECNRIRNVLEPISRKYHGPTDLITVNDTMRPMVLLLGNHSSGKSSFINFILKRDVQMTGVSSTDDCFTIIVPTEENDFDLNGAALINDPESGFDDLKSFGPNLINHTQLKARVDTAVKDFIVIDSPGMSTSPSSLVGDRGYDFENVCRWYAERADLVLWFFDVNKPGTTGETWSTLAHTMVGIDHKMLIVLNKADQFRRMDDFAKAYGTLCWNLSKVIPRRNMCLPRIHTTSCVPISSDGMRDDSVRLFSEVDLEEGRGRIVEKVMEVSNQRVENEVHRLFESMIALQLHCKLLDQVVQQYQEGKSHSLSDTVSLFFGWATKGMVACWSPSLAERSGSNEVCFMCLLTNAILKWYNAYDSVHYLRTFHQRSTYEAIIARFSDPKDAFTQKIAQLVLDRFVKNVRARDLPNLPRLLPSDMTTLTSILDEDIATVQRRIMKIC